MTRRQILDLFQSLQATTRLPLLFITHDLASVSRIAHGITVMRLRRLLEIGAT
jgi:peptide/nickel transport system ATP-binding protein